MFCLHVCKCTVYMPGSLGGQMKASDPWNLELWMVLSRHVGAINQAWVLFRSNKYTIFNP